MIIKLLFSVVLIFVLQLFLNVHNCKSQWVAYNIDNTLKNIFFSNPNTGWAIKSETYLCKTTNGGLNWANVSQNFSPLSKFSFPNVNTGFITGKISSTQKFYKTTNGGLSWYATSFYAAYSVTNLIFLDPNTGYYTYGIYLRKTTDGGTSWYEKANSIAFVSLAFSSSEIGYHINDYSKLYKTNNSGNTWTNIYNFGYSFIPYTITFQNNLTGYVLFDNIFKTTDGGYSWTTIIAATPTEKLDAYFLNDNTGWVCGRGGMVYNTINGGITWNEQISNTFDQLNKIQFFNDNTGYIYGNGVILKTINGGTGVQNISTEKPISFKMYQNFPNPFNSRTNIMFDIPKLSSIKIAVYDITGEKIETLVNATLQAGSYQTEWDASESSSGIYFARIQAGKFRTVIKMTILK